MRFRKPVKLGNCWEQRALDTNNTNKLDDINHTRTGVNSVKFFDNLQYYVLLCFLFLYILLFSLFSS